MSSISKRTVDAAKPGKDGRRFIVWDDRLPGFGLLVMPSGVKSYIFNYRNAEGRSRRATIAKVGSLTPAEARERAEDMSALVKGGGDPLDQKAQARQALTVSDILDRYLASARFAEKADSTRSIDQGRICRHIRPLLGREFAHKLTVESVRRAMSDIEAGKTAADIKTKKRGRARVQGGAGTAQKAIALFCAVLNWAKDENLIENNPAATIKLQPSGMRDTFLDDPEHYTRLFKTLAVMENEKRIRSPVADAIRLIALTGARKSEVTRCRWKHVDLKTGAIVLPPTSHKTGRRTGKPRIIALPAAAQEIIARQPAGESEDFVFQPAKGDGGETDLSRPWRRVRVEADLPAGIGLHGLQHSLATWFALSGAEAAQIMAALGHRNMATAQRYIHIAKDIRSTLAERAAAPALAGLASASGVGKADVVALPKVKRDG